MMKFTRSRMKNMVTLGKTNDRDDQSSERLDIYIATGDDSHIHVVVEQ